MHAGIGFESTFVYQSYVIEHTYILINFCMSFVIFMQYYMMHEDSLTPYRKYIDNKSSSQHSSFHHSTCYSKTSISFVIIRHSYMSFIHHHRHHLCRHYSILYNPVITSSFNIQNRHYSTLSLKPILNINYSHALRVSS